MLTQVQTQSLYSHPCSTGIRRYFQTMEWKYCTNYLECVMIDYKLFLKNKLKPELDSD